jgi:CRP/FNR family cyclic AMP-dependent transcriptional regulator
VEAFNSLTAPIGSTGGMSPRYRSSSGMTVTAARKLPEPPDALDFGGALRLECHADKALLYAPGDDTDRVFVVKSGCVRLLRAGPGGTHSLISILFAGDLFGSMFELAGEPEERAVAAGPTEVWSLSGSDLRVQLQVRPGLSMQLLQASARRIHSLQWRLSGFAFKEVPARLAGLISAIADANGEPCPHGGELHLRGVTQQDLADLAGASRSFTSTLINQMKRDGILRSVGRVLCVHDRSALRRIADPPRRSRGFSIAAA